MISILKNISRKIYFFYKKVNLKNKNVIIEKNVSFQNTQFCQYNKICKDSYVNDSNFGKYSYVGWNTILNNVEVGSFSSIGPYTEVIYGTHPIDFVSTHPVFYSTRKQNGTSFVNENKFNEFTFVTDTKRSAVIGNDVWIGYGVKIIEGITISDGAVVLAGAIVTKDVEAYSVVGGIPAKHIKFRFTPSQIEILNIFKWWEQDIQWIKSHVHQFSDVDAFCKLLKKKA